MKIKISGKDAIIKNDLLAYYEIKEMQFFKFSEINNPICFTTGCRFFSPHSHAFDFFGNKINRH